MILLGFLGQSFRQILICFVYFMDQGHMGFIAILKVHILVYQKQFLLSPKFFCKSWDSNAKYGKIDFGSFFRPY